MDWTPNTNFVDLFCYTLIIAKSGVYFNKESK